MLIEHELVIEVISQVNCANVIPVKTGI